MSEQCPIWKTECASITQAEDSLIITDSPRAGGNYRLHTDATAYLRDLTEDDKARLTTILVRERFLGNHCPSINAATMAQARSAVRMPMREKLDNVLRFLIDNTTVLGKGVGIKPLQYFDEAGRNAQYLLACSESTHYQEVVYLAESLHGRGLVETVENVQIMGDIYVPHSQGFVCAVTAAGYISIEQLRTEVKSDQCFVAMWFNEATDALYDRAIAPAVRAAGYEPLRH